MINLYLTPEFAKFAPGPLEYNISNRKTVNSDRFSTLVPVVLYVPFKIKKEKIWKMERDT